jgi:hypothetical protein
MDNGLIFPYPCGCVHGEPGDTNHPKLGLVFGPVWVERGI